MVFAIYLLISGIALPILIGALLYKKIRKEGGQKEVEKVNRSSQNYELES